MNLFFVYDTSYCKADEDDPKDAVVYFYPPQATESEHYLLCCQLVGVAKFLRVTFSTPSTIGLEQGKFAFHWSGKYLLVLGANTDIQSSVLHDQLSFLCGIFCFYHGSINNVWKTCKNDREEFLAKLELAWSRYINLSQCFGSVLQFSMNASPLIALRKSAGIVSKANRLLHMCQLSSSVMAGVIFYNNRILASQLTPQLNNYLSLMSNYNASVPVSNIHEAESGLPPDVELKCVHLSSKIISKVLSYNHALVGSQVRVRTTSKVSVKSNSLPTYNENDNSGSEGDIDSGNCSESVPNADNKCDSVFTHCLKKSNRVSSCTGAIAKWVKSPCRTSCCVGHWRLLRRKLLIGRNQSCLKFIYEADTAANKIAKIETEDSGIHSRTEWQRNVHCVPRTNHDVTGVNVLCNRHVNVQTSSFVSELKGNHFNFRSTSDLEFSCSLCQDRIQCMNPLSLKDWNSEVEVSKVHSNYGQSSCRLFPHKRKRGGRVKMSKVQVLKCRSNSESSSRFKTKPSFSSRKNHFYDPHGFHTKRNNSYIHRNSENISEKYADIESNELHKHILYVQRYGGSTLLLLLNEGYDEKIITYLWTCGFSILRDIEYNAEKISEEDNGNDMEPSFNLMLYNSAQKILKEYPHSSSVMLTEKWIKQYIQSIQANFQADPNIHSLSLLSADRSIYAAHRDNYFAFYVQPESNSRKLETLFNLSKRAVRRLEKMFKISL